MLKSRRVTPQGLAESIAWLRLSLPTQRQVDAAEAGGGWLSNDQKMARFVMPILVAQASGEFRWCGHCYKLTPDVDLNRCGGCNQIGYCEVPDEYVLDPKRMKRLGMRPCHVAHWKSGHKQECKRFQAEAAAAAAAAAAAVVEVAKAAAAAGGGGNKKKGKKKKGGRR
jgi:hypothetical protein